MVVALLLGHSSAPAPNPSTAATPVALRPITVSAPPSNPATQAPCTAVSGKLPITLAGLSGRPARSDSPFVAAWGDPAVVYRCGVARPAQLTAGSSAQIVIIDGVAWLPVAGKSATVWTAVDRTPYIEVSVPASYAQPPLAPLSDAIAAALAAVCVVDPDADLSRQCTRRP